jgi:predicted signal transduction protein with EAL and GGDEF domain
LSGESGRPILFFWQRGRNRIATSTFAANLGLGVVAEGVEDAETLAELTRLGCDAAQGYLISRPVPAGELAAWLADVSASSPPAWTARSRRLAVA